MKASELRQKNGAELNSLIVSLSKEQFNLRMQKGTQQLSKPDQVKKVRRDIARVQTIINELVRA
jgi:large subunit ribosomal protein L29